MVDLAGRTYAPSRENVEIHFRLRRPRSLPRLDLAVHYGAPSNEDLDASRQLGLAQHVEARDDGLRSRQLGFAQ